MFYFILAYNYGNSWQIFNTFYADGKRNEYSAKQI